MPADHDNNRPVSLNPIPCHPEDTVVPVSRVVIPADVNQEKQEKARRQPAGENGNAARKDEKISARCDRLLSAIQESLNLLTGLSGSNCLECENLPVLIPLDAGKQYLLLDPQKANPPVYNGYYSYAAILVHRGTPVPDGFIWRLCNAHEAAENLAILQKRLNNRDSDAISYKDVSRSCGRYYGMMDFTGKSRPFGNHTRNNRVTDVRLAECPQKTALEFAFKHGGIPVLSLDCFPEEDVLPVISDRQQSVQAALDCLKTCWDAGLIQISAAGKDYRISWKADYLTKLDAWLKSGQALVLGDMVISTEVLAEEEAARVFDALRRKDFERASITEYDWKQFEDPSRGSWELYDYIHRKPQEGGQEISLMQRVYARNPKLDVQKNGIVGIDFGTKSTVVVHLGNDNTIHPLRIGSDRLEKVPTASDYENPTVMHFINIDRFMEQYRAAAGRPQTAWRDLTVSHTAFSDRMENEEASRCFCFFENLKQWAGTPDRQVRIRDEQEADFVLPPYRDLNEGDFDPIELFAYYIGLHINNQNTGSICLEYLLSFSVTDEKAVRDRILASFRKGILKSLPEAILQDQECMEQFSVSEGVSEPAAYAVCALQEFGFHPKDGEKVFYGVFDFGAAASEFDFGVWRKANGPKERRYHHVIQHFGNGGDRYLGGERLLEDMAYQVFTDNQEKLRKDQITFYRPNDRQYQDFPGSEYTISPSQEAGSNTRQLVRELRPFWEHPEKFGSFNRNKPHLESKTLQLRLFNRMGKKLENYELKVDYEKLEKLLQDRIRSGVKQFFSACRAAILQNHDEAEQAKKINIFLAGNSGKSARFKAIFQEEMAGFIQERKVQAEALHKDTSLSDDYFDLFDPLGTPGADERIALSAQDAVSGTVNSIGRPTGKTGVAIGLVECRRGSRIKVISEKPAEEKFKFSIGYDDEDGFFCPVVSRGAAYNKWFEYIDAGEKYFEFCYTSLPAAEIAGTLPASQASTSRQQIPDEAVDEDLMICLRCVSPDEIEYVAAKSMDAAEQGRYRCPIRRIKLEEI